MKSHTNSSVQNVGKGLRDNLIVRDISSWILPLGLLSVKGVARLDALNRHLRATSINAFPLPTIVVYSTSRPQLRVRIYILSTTCRPPSLGVAVLWPLQWFNNNPQLSPQPGPQVLTRASPSNNDKDRDYQSENRQTLIFSFSFNST